MGDPGGSSSGLQSYGDQAGISKGADFTDFGTGAYSLTGLATGTYTVREGEVTVDLEFPMLIPGSLRRKVEQRIGEKLDGLFA